MYSPEHGSDVENCADEDDDHSDKEDDEEDHEFPRMTRSNCTHSLYRSIADVIHVCAHVTDTAAVDVFLNSYLTLFNASCLAFYCNYRY